MDEEPSLSRPKLMIRREPKGRQKSKGGGEETKEREVAWGSSFVPLTTVMTY